MKVLICLKEKQIEFVSHYVNLLLFEQHEPEFVRINPNGQVPVLVHDGRVITESTVINEYLDDVYPDIALRPEDPYWRAMMRTWSKFVDDYFCPALSMIGWHVMVRKAAQAISKDELDKVLERIPLQAQREKWATVAGDSFTEQQLAESRRRLGRSIEKMEQILGASTWLAGEAYSLADANTFSMVSGVERLHPEILSDKKTPLTRAWLERMRARPGVQAALAMPNKVPETLRAFG
jgi:glutathione S-transferase